MTIYDSKEDVIKTILPQSGFLSLGLLMITEYLIASVFVMWQSSDGVSQSVLVQCSDGFCDIHPLISLLPENPRKFKQELAIPAMTVLAWFRHLLEFSSDTFFVQHLTRLP